MFSHISLTGLKTSKLFEYARDVPFFKGRKQQSFKSGLNILVGPNGCGKSTLLNMLGESMCATQGGVSSVTQTVVSKGVDMSAGLRTPAKKGSKASMTDNLGLSVSHDGQPVIFCDPRQTVGIVAGSFDDDFFSQGITETMAKGSHGQKALRRFSAVLDILGGEAPFPKEIQRTLKSSAVNDVWRQALDVIEKRFEASLPKGQPTVLLDEPESNHSIQWQMRLWSFLSRPELAEKFQIIVASHSVFALGIPHANYIDMVPGFRAEVEDALRARFAPPA